MAPLWPRYSFLAEFTKCFHISTVLKFIDQVRDLSSRRFFVFLRLFSNPQIHPTHVNDMERWVTSASKPRIGELYAFFQKHLIKSFTSLIGRPHLHCIGQINSFCRDRWSSRHRNRKRDDSLRPSSRGELSAGRIGD